MEKIRLDKKSLKKFGITMGWAFLVLTLLVLWRKKYIVSFLPLISVVFFSLAFSFPNFLKPIYIVWMRIAFILGWINTRLILFIIFYLIFTPIGLGMKLFGVDLLDRKIDRRKNSYWKKKDKREFSPLDYERRF